MVVGELDDGNVVIPSTPAGSQTSSLMLSAGADTSMQNTPQKVHASTLSSLPDTSEAGLASSATPTKATAPKSKPVETPQSVGNNPRDKDDTLTSTGDSPSDSSTKTRKSNTKKSC